MLMSASLISLSLENGLKIGKIQGLAAASNGAKKPYKGFPKKKEGDTNAASTSKGKDKAYQTPYYQVVEVTPNNYQTHAIPASQQQVQYQPSIQYQQPYAPRQDNYQQYQSGQQRLRRQERKFDPLPMSCIQILIIY